VLLIFASPGCCFYYSPEPYRSAATRTLLKSGSSFVDVGHYEFIGEWWAGHTRSIHRCHSGCLRTKTQRRQDVQAFQRWWLHLRRPLQISGLKPTAKADFLAALLWLHFGVLFSLVASCDWPCLHFDQHCGVRSATNRGTRQPYTVTSNSIAFDNKEVFSIPEIDSNVTDRSKLRAEGILATASLLQRI
jgi:hypothetical protein